MQTAQLIPVFTGSIHNESTQLVDARTLHRFLEVDAHFKDWIARRIAEYDFQEDEDFCSFLSKSGGGRPRREYSITLDMGKELAMVERNEKGRQARRYFIECEKRLHQIAPEEASTIMGQTIGTDGFHMLGALIKGKVTSLPQDVRRRATMKIWSQTHAAFGVRSAADIPSDQLDSARNFIAAYALEGEWLPKDEIKGFGALIGRPLGRVERWMVSTDYKGDEQYTSIPMGAYVLTFDEFIQAMLVHSDMPVSTDDMFRFVELAMNNLKSRATVQQHQLRQLRQGAKQ